MPIINKQQLFVKKLMSMPCESLSENICHLKIGRDLRKRNNPRFKSLTNEMAINLNMFGAFMEDEVGKNVNYTIIIYMKRSRTAMRKNKLN